MSKKRKLVEFIDDVGAEPKFIEVDDVAQDASGDEEDDKEPKEERGQGDLRP